MSTCMSWMFCIYEAFPNYVNMIFVSLLWICRQNCLIPADSFHKKNAFSNSMAQQVVKSFLELKKKHVATLPLYAFSNSKAQRVLMALVLSIIELSVRAPFKVWWSWHSPFNSQLYQCQIVLCTVSLFRFGIPVQYKWTDTRYIPVHFVTNEMFAIPAKISWAATRTRLNLCQCACYVHENGKIQEQNGGNTFRGVFKTNMDK